MSFRRLLAYEAGCFAVLAVALLFVSEPAASDGGCASLRNVQDEAVDVAAASLVPREREVLVFAWDFRHGRRPFQDSTRLSWEGGPPFYEASGSGSPEALAFDEDGRASGLGQVAPGDILSLRMKPPRANQSQEIPEGSFGFYAVAIEDGVSVKVCVEPHEASPGVYNSAIRFDDPDLRASPIGVELTVKENDVRLPLLAALAGLAAGIILVTAKWNETGGGARPGALFIGLGVAIIGVVPPSYALWSENPTWGQDLVLDMFSLFAAVAVGVFGSAAVGDALSPVKAPADPGAPPPAGGTAAAGGTTVAAGSTMAGGPSAAGATTAPGGRSAAGSGDDGEGARR